jgi:DNA-directed RNA polymerase subunit K/omega
MATDNDDYTETNPAPFSEDVAEDHVGGGSSDSDSEISEDSIAFSDDEDEAEQDEDVDWISNLSEGAEKGGEELDNIFSVDDDLPEDLELVSNFDATKIRTTRYLTKYEQCRVLGWRSEQIGRGAPPMIGEKDKVDGKLIFPNGYPVNTYDIAVQELLNYKCPAVICRPLPNGEKIHVAVSSLKLLSGLL